MQYNFDEIINRKHTKSLKHDFWGKSGKTGYNAIPLWIADMDFRTPPGVQQAIVERAKHGIFGYSGVDDDYFHAVSSWMFVRHGWEVEQDWLLLTNGVLSSISAAISALTVQNDAILLQYPSYHMFDMLIERNKRKLVKNELVLEKGEYHIDFDDFERQIVRNGVKIFILCSPHNPVGRVWTREELVRMGDICLKHQVLVISDEIHQDFIFASHRHLVFASLRPEYEKIAITCTSPTKTFNLSGLEISNIFIPDQELQDKISDELMKRGHFGAGILEILACQAAYESGGKWLDELLQYLADNIAYARSFVREKIPEIDFIEPEGTYLLWLDCRRLGFWAKELEAYLADEAKVILNGAPGAEGFLRINIACPRATLEKAFPRVERAIRKL